MLRRKTGILDNTAHRVRVNGVVSWDGHNSSAVGHDNVLTLPGHVEANLFERPDGPEVRYPNYLRHALDCDLYFS